MILFNILLLPECIEPVTRSEYLSDKSNAKVSIVSYAIPTGIIHLSLNACSIISLVSISGITGIAFGRGPLHAADIAPHSMRIKSFASRSLAFLNGIAAWNTVGGFPLK